MEDIDNTRDLSHINYDDEPVVYCKHCLSLAVRILDDNVDYCDICGSTDTESADITSWEMMYKDKYGNYLINKK